MYNSLKSWINLPVTIHRCVGRNGTGAKQYAEPVSTLCYAQGESVVVTNAQGEEVVSNSQLYFDGNTLISIIDKITFENVDCDIKSINTFYRDGKADLKVVYL
jgi:hypothetical protein